MYISSFFLNCITFIYTDRVLKRVIKHSLFTETECSLKTKNGSCCVLPFIFDGTQLESCTTLGDPDSSRLLWCGLTSNVDEGGLFGECRVDGQGKRNDANSILWLPFDIQRGYN